MVIQVRETQSHEDRSRAKGHSECCRYGVERRSVVCAGSVDAPALMRWQPGGLRASIDRSGPIPPPNLRPERSIDVCGCPDLQASEASTLNLRLKATAASTIVRFVLRSDSGEGDEDR